MAKKMKLIPLTGAADFKAKADEWAKLDNEIATLEAQLGEEQDALLKKFEKEPVKVIEELIGVDLPDDVVKKIIDGVKASITIEDAKDLLGSLKKLF